MTDTARTRNDLTATLIDMTSRLSMVGDCL